MSVSITDNHPQIKAKVSGSTPIFLRMFGEAVLLRANPNTPYKDGQLRRMTRINAIGNKGQIRWLAGYAAFQERGYTTGPVRRYTTAGTGKQFAENAVRAVAKDSKAIAKKAGLI